MEITGKSRVEGVALAGQVTDGWSQCRASAGGCGGRVNFLVLGADSFDTTCCEVIAFLFVSREKLELQPGRARGFSSGRGFSPALQRGEKREEKIVQRCKEG